MALLSKIVRIRKHRLLLVLQLLLLFLILFDFMEIVLSNFFDLVLKILNVVLIFVGFKQPPLLATIGIV